MKTCDSASPTGGVDGGGRYWDALEWWVFHGRTPTAAARDAEAILRHAGCGAGIDALDLCCGYGRHAIELARRGCSVVAVDRKASYLRVGAAEARQAGVRVEYVNADIRSYRPTRQFDLVTCLGSSLGYFESKSDDARLLERVIAALRPGGSLVLQLMSADVIHANFRPYEVYEHGDDVLFVRRTLTSRLGACWLENDYTVFSPRGVETVHRAHWLYYPGELTTMIATAGASEISLFGDLAGAPYGDSARELVLVARKD